MCAVAKPEGLKVGELIGIKMGNSIKIGKIKSIVCGGVYAYVEEAEKAIRILTEDILKITNAYTIKTTTLGKTWRDEPATEKQIAYIKAMRDYCVYTLPYIDYQKATKGEAHDYISKFASMAHETVYGLENEDMWGDRT
jgi:hypothetical protein